MVILCTASQAHLSWEQLQFLSELFLFFRNGAVKGEKGRKKKKKLIKISTQTDKEKKKAILISASIDTSSPEYMKQRGI